MKEQSRQPGVPVKSEAPPEFDEIVRLATMAFQMPAAFVNLVDEKSTEAHCPFAGHVNHSGRSLVVPDATIDARFQDHPVVTGPANVRFYAGTPLFSANRSVMGVLSVIDHEPRSFSPEQVRSLESLAELASEHVELPAVRDEQKRLRETIREQESEAARLYEHTQRLLAEAVERSNRDSLTGLLNHRSFHNQLEVEAERAVKSNGTLAVAMMDLDNFRFFNDAYGHRAGDDVLRLISTILTDCCRPGDCLARYGGDEFAMLLPGLDREAATKVVSRMTDVLDRRGYLPPGASTPIPLRIAVGIAVFPHEASTRLEAIEFADTRLHLCKCGADDRVLAADLLRNTMAKQVTGFSMLDALIAAVDNKDRYTRRHSEEVLAYSVDVCREMGLSDEMQHDTAVAALLHDVGKIGVPDPILRKPGRLTVEEFEIIKQHVTMGAVIVQAVPGFEVTLDAIRYHHERWDGTGYPEGLKGEQIPLMARIIGVADAYSAMTTDRPYRKGMTPEVALGVLVDGIGRQWDPTCVEALANSRRKNGPLAMSTRANVIVDKAA